MTNDNYEDDADDDYDYYDCDDTEWQRFYNEVFWGLCHSYIID